MLVCAAGCSNMNSPWTYKAPPPPAPTSGYEIPIPEAPPSPRPLSGPSGPPPALAPPTASNRTGLSATVSAAPPVAVHYDPLGGHSPQEGQGAPVSFDFRDADVRGVLRMLADVSGKEIVATDDVRGGITLKLDNTPWDAALDIVARTMNLSVERFSNLIRVTSAARAEADEEARARTELLHTEMFPLRFAHAATVADMLNGDKIRAPFSRNDLGGPPVTLYPDEVYGLGLIAPRGAPPQRQIQAVKPGILSPRGSATADEPTNTLIVSDVQRAIESVRDVIATIDRPAPQVEIESRIVEVRDDFERDLGVQWGYKYTASPATGNPTGYNFPGTIAFGGAQTVPPEVGLNNGIDPVTGALIPFVADFPAGGNFGPGNGSALDLVLGAIDQSQFVDVRLTQLEQLHKLKIIARPRVVTRNNQEATIKSVDVLRVRLPQSTVIGGYAVGVATQAIEVGIELKIRPQVSSDGFVLLDLKAISSNLNPAEQVDNIPVQQERETESHVLLREGQTLVIGGIYRTQKATNTSGIPYLDAVPGLGWLFGSVNSASQREDLVIFVTPHHMTIVPGWPAAGVLPPARQLWLNRTTPGG